MPKIINLYSTTHCHLCDEAIYLLNKLSLHAISVIEIANDEHLLNKYGTRIPVLQRLDTKAELNWPFNADDIALFLKG